MEPAVDDALVRCAWPELSPRFAAALRAAVGFVFQRFAPVGVVAAGSIVRGEADRASDLDVYVVHTAPYKQRIQRWFGDVPAELFVNPPGAIREYFVREHERGRPSTAHMLATGFPVWRTDLLDGLRSEAAQWLAKQSPGA